ncbi:MAG: FeoB-associated Cys-rich membrane protein [Clostridiales bacterium]
MQFFTYTSTMIVLVICVVLVVFAVRKMIKDNKNSSQCAGCCSHCAKTQIKYGEKIKSSQQSCDKAVDKV